MCRPIVGSDSEYDSEEDDYFDEDDGAPQPEAVILPSGPQAALLANFIQQMPPDHADMEPEHNDPNDATNASANRRAMTKSPPELWMEYMEDVRNGRLKALKITDEGLAWFLDPDDTLPHLLRVSLVILRRSSHKSGRLLKQAQVLRISFGGEGCGNWHRRHNSRQS